jgi:hypothetical protein
MHYYYNEKETAEQWLLSREWQEDMENFYLSNQNNWEKTKFYLKAAALTGNEVARNSQGALEFDHFCNYDQAIKHWIKRYG